MGRSIINTIIRSPVVFVKEDRAAAAVVGILGALFCLYLTAELVQNREKPEIKRMHEWAEQRVRNWIVKNPGILVRTASEFSGEDVTLDGCEWSAANLWHGKAKNPNWLSGIDGVTEIAVFCDAGIVGGSDAIPVRMQFRWKVDTGGKGVTSFEWGWPPYDD
jgi:hypothetical protein